MRASAAAASASHPLVAIAWDGAITVVPVQQSDSFTQPPVCCQLDGTVRWLRWAPRAAPALLAASGLGELALCECARGAAAGHGEPALRHSATFFGDSLVALEWLGAGSSSGVDGVLPHGWEGFVTVGACAAVTVRWRLCFLAETDKQAAWTTVRALIPSLDAVDCAAVGGFEPALFVLAAWARSLGGSVLLCHCSLLDETGSAPTLSVVPVSQLHWPPSPSRVLWLGFGGEVQILLARREATRTTLQLWRRRGVGATGGHVAGMGLAPDAAAWEFAGQVVAPTELGRVRLVSCSHLPGSGGSISSVSSISSISTGSSAPSASPVSTVLLQHEGGAISAFDAGDWSQPPRAMARISAAEVAAAATPVMPSTGAGFVPVYGQGSVHAAPSGLPSASSAAAPAHQDKAGAARHLSKRARLGRCHAVLAVPSPHGTLAVLVGSPGGGMTPLGLLALHPSFLLESAPPGTPDELSSEMPPRELEFPAKAPAPSEAALRRHVLWLSEQVASALDVRSPYCSPWDLLGAGGMCLRPSVERHVSAAVRTLLAALLPLQLAAAPAVGARAVDEIRWRQRGPRCYALLAALSHSRRDARGADGYRLLLALALSGSGLIDRLRLATSPAEAAFLSAIDDAGAPGDAMADATPVLSPAGLATTEGAQGATTTSAAADPPAPAVAARAHPPAGAPDYSALLPECEWLLLLTWLWLRGRAEAGGGGGDGQFGTGLNNVPRPDTAHASVPGSDSPPADTPGAAPGSDSADAAPAPWGALPPPVRKVLPLATAIALKGARAAEGERRLGAPRAAAVAQLPVGALVALHRAAAPLLGSQPAGLARADAPPHASADTAWRLDGARRRLGLSDTGGGDGAAGPAGARAVAPPLPRLATAVVAGPLRAYQVIAQWAGIHGYRY